MDPAEREAVEARAAGVMKRARALADAEWELALSAVAAENKHLFSSGIVEGTFKAAVVHAYIAANKDALNEARAAIEATSERRRLRASGRNPEQKN